MRVSFVSNTSSPNAVVHACRWDPVSPLVPGTLGRLQGCLPETGAVPPASSLPYVSREHDSAAPREPGSHESSSPPSSAKRPSPLSVPLLALGRRHRGSAPPRRPPSTPGRAAPGGLLHRKP